MHIEVWHVLLGVLITLAIYAAFNIRSVRKHAIKEPGLWRGWLTFNDPDYRYKGVDYHLEVAYGRKRSKTLGVGFRIHFGDRGSETPFHFDIYGYWFAIFFSMNTPNMGKFFQWLGRGHKRDISLRTHGGQLWWDLWFNDDMGYDRHHNCDGWRTLWWWPFKNKKYRPWACLRHGNIPLNPLDAWWGARYYAYEPVDLYEDTFGVYQFEDDFYDVVFSLRKVTQARRHGPKWARRVTDRGYTVEWDCREGIPVQNHDWKGDCVYASSVDIENPHENWLGQAHNALQEWVIKERQRNNYRPPVGKIINIIETDDGIVIEGKIDHISGSAILESVKAGEVEGLSIAPGFGNKGEVTEVSYVSPSLLKHPLPKGITYTEFGPTDEKED